MSSSQQAALSSAVQLGFVLGAFVSAFLGIADRFDPRRVLALCACIAAGANLGLAFVSRGEPCCGDTAPDHRYHACRSLSGRHENCHGLGRERPRAAGRHPGWCPDIRVVPAAPGGVDGWRRLEAGRLRHVYCRLCWRFVCVGSRPWSASCALTGIFRPFHIPCLDRQTHSACLWRLPGPYVGTVCHVGVAAGCCCCLLCCFAEPARCRATGKSDGISGDCAGRVGVHLGGWSADRIGKANIAVIAMVGSLAAGLATAASFGGPWWLTFVLFIVWGVAIIPDSAQFSALVADAAPPHLAGSLLTLQTALGFLLTFATVQLTPVLADHVGWQATLAVMAAGPALGIVAMWPLRERT